MTATAKRAKPATEDPEKDFLKLAHDRFNRIKSSEDPWRSRAIEELSFADGLQHWTAEQLTERKGRPCLTFDRIGPSVDQVVNDARQNPPEPQVKPVGSGVDKEDAEIVQGLIRNIANDSSADIAFMTGYEHAVKVGRGWWRVLSQYESDASFYQKLVIKRISNLFSVYPDPAADEWDYSDMRYCFVTEDLDRTVFEELHPDASSGPWEGMGDKVKSDWFPDGAVRIAEYWWVEETPGTIALLPNGETMNLEEVPEGARVIATRQVMHRKVHGAKITGSDVLEEWEWPGKWIPIIPCLGREYIEDGKRKLRGMIRAAMDANLQYDYQRSKLAEAVGLAPISQWLVAAGQTEEWAPEWADSNRKAYSTLKYKPISLEGQAVPPPIRISPSGDVGSIVQAIGMADNDIKATLSTYDASLGNAGPESSGRAILARQKEGDNAHFNFHDNLARSMRHTGRILVDLIPHFYDEARSITVFDPDGSSKLVQVNGPGPNAQPADRIFNLKDGGLLRYDVIISSGPSYATRRQEGQAALMELVRTLPQVMAPAADLLIRSIDAPMMDEIAQRVTPPAIAAQQQSDSPLPPAAQAQIQNMGMAIEQLQAALKQATDEMNRDRLKYAAQKEIAELQERTKLVTALAKMGSDEAQTQLKAEMDYIMTNLSRIDAAIETGNPPPQIPAPQQQPGQAPGGAPAPAAPVPPGPQV